MTMAVNSNVMCNQVSCNRPNFKGGEKEFMPKDMPADSVDFSTKAEKPKRSWGKAIASGIIPGLGQALDDRIGDGAKQFGAVVGLGILSRICAVAGLASKSKIGGTAGIIAGCAAGIGAFATSIYSIIDAYKCKNA